MSVINLNRASPKRLTFARHQWSLEVERFVPLDRDLFDPVVTSIVGAEPILAYLHEIDQPPELVAAATQIVGQRAATGCSYELSENRFVLVDPGHNDDLPGSPPPVAASTQENDFDLQSLARQFSQMEERLSFLERQLSGKLASNDNSPSVLPLNHEDSAPHSGTG